MVCGKGGSDVEAEVHDVAVLDYVFLAFYGHLAGFLDGGLASQRDEVVVFDHFCADESFLEVGVDDAGGLRSLGAAEEGPGTDLVRARREVGLEVEQGVGCADEA